MGSGKTPVVSTANDAWRERNDLVQMNTAVPRKELEAFDKACKKRGVSRREALRGLMGRFRDETRG